MIRHCVMLRLAADADQTGLETVLADLGALVDQLDGCSGFLAGPNRDFERKSVGFDVGFTLDACDDAALARYAAHPTHKALGAKLVALCEGGADGIRVYDLEAGP